MTSGLPSVTELTMLPDEGDATSWAFGDGTYANVSSGMDVFMARLVATAETDWLVGSPATSMRRMNIEAGSTEYRIVEVPDRSPESDMRVPVAVTLTILVSPP